MGHKRTKEDQDFDPVKSAEAISQWLATKKGQQAIEEAFRSPHGPQVDPRAHPFQQTRRFRDNPVTA